MALILPILSSLSASQAGAQSLPDNATLRVALVDGTEWTALLDRRTDEADLWLRFVRGSASIVRPVPWPEVVQVEIAGETLSGRKLHGLIRRMVDAMPAQAAIAPSGRRLALPASTPASAHGDSVPSDLSARTQPAVVRWLSIDAAAANWDAGVEVDGLRVRVAPRDAQGRIVPVRGRLDVELIGQRQGIVRHPQPFGRLGHWSVPIAIDDFGPDGAEIRLPFQGAHPEFDMSIAPRAAVHARLSVPGQGVFEATDVMTRIRPYSAVRDAQQHATGGRFFPGELTGRSRSR